MNPKIFNNSITVCEYCKFEIKRGVPAIQISANSAVHSKCINDFIYYCKNRETLCEYCRNPLNDGNHDLCLENIKAFKSFKKSLNIKEEEQNNEIRKIIDNFSKEDLDAINNYFLTQGGDEFIGKIFYSKKHHDYFRIAGKVDNSSTKIARLFCYKYYIKFHYHKAMIYDELIKKVKYKLDVRNEYGGRTTCNVLIFNNNTVVFEPKNIEERFLNEKRFITVRDDLINKDNTILYDLVPDSDDKDIFHIKKCDNIIQENFLNYLSESIKDNYKKEVNA